MNVEEASKKWNVSKETVRVYCRDDIIPDAHKEKRKLKNLLYEEWDIPEIEKPPARRYGLIIYMKKISVIHEGAEPKFYRNIDEVKNIYEYLSNNGFITKYTYRDNIIESLKSVNITSEGKKLIIMEDKDYKVDGEMLVSAGFSGIKPSASVTFKKSFAM